MYLNMRIYTYIHFDVAVSLFKLHNFTYLEWINFEITKKKNPRHQKKRMLELTDLRLK